MSKKTNKNAMVRRDTAAVTNIAAHESYSHLRTLSTSVLLDRLRFAKQNGLTFNGERDEYEILGYDRTLTNKMFRDEYDRGGIAGRIIDAFPHATWRGNIEVVEDEDPDVKTPFEEAWDNLDRKHKLQAKLQRADKLSRLSTYSVILIGARGGGSLEDEMPRGRGNPDGLLYFQPYLGGGGPGVDGRQGIISAMDANCTIMEYDTDPKSERYGLPKFYQLRNPGFSNVDDSGGRIVHWSRIVHIAEGLLDNDVFGQPALERVWNLLIDLRKVTGGGAEAFWLRANQGMQWDLDKDMQFPEQTASAELERMRVQADEYQHNIRRILRTRGVTITPLGSDVANFGDPADAILTQIAGATSIPKRILTGSEMGELASSQDRDNWKDQIVTRQTQYAGPYIVRQLVDRLIQYGYLPPPKGGPDEYQVEWPMIESLTEEEKADGATKWATVNSTNGDVVFTDAEIRDKWYGMEPLTDEQRNEINEAKAAKAQEQMDMMKFKASLNPGKPVRDKEEDRELAEALAEAIATGDTDRVNEILGLE